MKYIFVQNLLISITSNFYLILLGVLLFLQILTLKPLSKWLEKHGSSFKISIEYFVVLFVSGAISLVLCLFLNIRTENNPFILLIIISLSALIINFLKTIKLGKMFIRELILAVLWNLQIIVFLLLLQNPNIGLFSTPVRAVFVLPFSLFLCGYFGASCGYLLNEESLKKIRWEYEFFIGSRFLLSKSSPVLSIVTNISILGVTLGVWLVIVALGILSGFEHDLKDKIMGANAHILIQKNNENSFKIESQILKKIKNTENVLATTSYIEGEVVIASDTNYTGALAFGIPPMEASKVLTVFEQLKKQGDLNTFFENPDPKKTKKLDVKKNNPLISDPINIPNIIIGKEIQKILNVVVGDKITIISPLKEIITPLGTKPKSQPFIVSAIFSSQMYDFDSRFIFMSLKNAENFFDFRKAYVSGIKIRVKDPDISDVTGDAILKKIGSDKWKFLDWKVKNMTLFSALKLEQVITFIVLVFIILVASFSIVNTLTMSISEKKKEIAILKTMGSRNISIMKIFLIQGILVGGVGIILGVMFALLTIQILQIYGFWIPDEVYYINSLPVYLEKIDVILVIFIAFLIVWDFAVYPALRGAFLKPVEGLRDG